MCVIIQGKTILEKQVLKHFCLSCGTKLLENKC